MPLLLDLAYIVLLAVLSPLLLWRMLRGKYRDGWSEKLLGRVPVREGQRPCFWFHAVSVGEVLQLEPVLAELRRRLPAVEFVISTTTPTGRSVAITRFQNDRVCYFPLDFSWAVREAVRRLRPTAIVLVELELWPNLILRAHRCGIPLALINGRVSERSSRGYARIRPLITRLLDCFEVLAVQNALYADRLNALAAGQTPLLRKSKTLHEGERGPRSVGTSATADFRDRIHVTGSIKFDRVTTDRRNPKTLELRRSFGIADSQRVFIAGNTHDPEESAALDSYVALRRQFPNLRLILVPRHKERFDEVARLVQSRGLPLLRRSEALSAAPADGACAHRPEHLSQADTSVLDAPPILLLDTLGELAACWGLADVAFVGGSLTKRGGQNMIEPAGYGAALLFGPHTHNFRDVVELLLANEAARLVHDAAELTAAVEDCLKHSDSAREQGARARRLVVAQQGATAQTVELLVGLSCFPDARISHAA